MAVEREEEEVKKWILHNFCCAYFFFLFRESSAKKKSLFLLHWHRYTIPYFPKKKKKTSVFLCFCNKFNAEHKALPIFRLFLFVSLFFCLAENLFLWHFVKKFSSDTRELEKSSFCWEIYPSCVWKGVQKKLEWKNLIKIKRWLWKKSDLEHN